MPFSHFHIKIYREKDNLCLLWDPLMRGLMLEARSQKFQWLQALLADLKAKRINTDPTYNIFLHLLGSPDGVCNHINQSLHFDFAIAL